jgi:hypothetical protein
VWILMLIVSAVSPALQTTQAEIVSIRMEASKNIDFYNLIFEYL